MQLFRPQLLLLLFGLVVYFSCKKIDSSDKESPQDTESIEKKFFRQHASTDLAIQSLTAFVKSKNDKSHFVEKVAKQIGYPRWDKALTRQSRIVAGRGNGSTDTADITYIPFVRDSQHYVNAAIIIKTTNTDTAFRYICDWQYKDYGFDTTSAGWNARTVFNLFTLLDNQTFGHTRFKVIDSLLFGGGNVTANLLSINNATQRMDPSTQCSYYEIVTCTTWGGAKTSAMANPCTTSYQSFCTTIWTWTPDDSGGGGGGGGGDGPPKCPNNVSGRRPEDDPPPCGPGWEPIEDDDDYNPTIAGNVIIDTSISNNFPCVVALLDTISQYGNLNQKAQIALSQIFGVNKKITTTIKLDRSLIGTTTSAFTRKTGSIPDPSDTSQLAFAATIYVNPDIFQNATKEYIVTTLVHEAMHAYIDYIFTLYNQGYIPPADSGYIKSKFPIFWGGISPYSSPSEIQQHNLMALNWVQQVSDPLYAFTNNDINPAIKDSVYRALGWGGLEDADIFKMKADKCNIMAINLIARFKNQGVPFTINGHPECTSSYNITASSLKLKSLCD